MPNLYNETDRLIFIEDYRQVIENNSVFDKVLSEEKTDRNGMYEKMNAYFQVFTSKESDDGPAKGLLTFIALFNKMQNCFDEYRHEKNPDARDMNFQNAMAYYEILKDGFNKTYRSFVSQYGEKTLFNNSMKMVSSMVSTVDDISACLSLFDRSEELEKLYAEKAPLEKEQDSLNYDIRAYTETCLKMNLSVDDPMADIAKEEETLRSLESELTKFRNEEIENWKSLKESNSKIVELSENIRQITIDYIKNQEKAGNLQYVEGLINIIGNEVEAINSDSEICENEIQQLDESIKNYDQMISETEKGYSGIEEYENFYSNMKPDDKELVDRYSYNLIGSGKLDEALDAVRMFRHIGDISDAFRQTQGGTVNMDKYKGTFDGMILNGYIAAKNIIKQYAPDLAEEVFAYENDLSKKIPSDFAFENLDRINVCIEKMIAENQQISSSESYKKYIDANKKQIIAMSSKAQIDEINELKEVAQKRKAELQERIKENNVNSTRWHRSIEENLGFLPPEPVTVQSVKDLIASEKEKCSRLEMQLAGKAFQMQKSFYEESNRNVSLKSCNIRVKSTNLSIQVKNQKDRIEKIKELKDTREDIVNRQASILKKNSDLQSKYENIVKNDQYTEVKNRLTDIRDHFFDVGSRKMTNECSAMYQQLDKTILALNDGTQSKEFINEQLNSLNEKTSAYLTAKYSQNISKLFSSDQRFSRISKAEELLNYTNTAKLQIDNVGKHPYEERLTGFLNSDIRNIDTETFVSRNIKICKQDIANEKRLGLGKQKDSAPGKTFVDINAPMMMEP